MGGASLLSSAPWEEVKAAKGMLTAKTAFHRFSPERFAGNWQAARSGGLLFGFALDNALEYPVQILVQNA